MVNITVNETQLFYTQPGKDAQGRPLLLLHGAGGSHLDWPRDIQRLPGVQVINLDLPGHGRSQGGGYKEIGQYAEQVSDFAQALALQNACVAGHSMGGAVALALALKQPSWLSALILIGTGARLRVAQQLLAGLQEDVPGAINWIMRYAWRETSPAATVARSADAMSAADEDQLYLSFAACDRFDVRDEVFAIHVPTLILCGADDRMTPPEYSWDLARRIPNSQLVIVENAGHYVTLEQPQRVAAAMRDFLAVL